MKLNYIVSFAAVLGMFLTGCTKTESDFSEQPIERIEINAGTLNTNVGTIVNFTVTSSIKGDITTTSRILINDTLINGSSYRFTVAGTYTIYAKKDALSSASITINVVSITTAQGNFKHKVLVEEYSGTWCGNCPRILYGVDLLHKQTNDAVVVGIHLFGNDPFITTDGNSLAAQQKVSGVPTGIINRDAPWNGPQYENVNQVITNLQASSVAGLAISSTMSSSNLSIAVKVGYAQPVNGEVKLHVYLVEDKLYHTQSNYSSNLYGGLSSIPNFEYNGVLRKILSGIEGDIVASAGMNNEKAYSFTLPSSIVRNTGNLRIVAFITNNAGKVLNVQEAFAGQNIPFQYL